MTAAKLYFEAIDSTGRYNLWVTDGTSAGTTAVSAPPGNFNGLQPSNFTADGNQVFFQGFDAAGKVNLFVINAATNTAQELTPAGANASGLSPSKGAVYGGKLYFGGRDQSGSYQLWSSDGTSAGTAEVSLPSLSAGQYNGSYYPSDLTLLQGQLYFTAGSVINALYHTDGTAAGTVQISPGSGSFFQISGMASLGSDLILGGNGVSAGPELWTSDGTSAATSGITVPGLNPTNNPATRPASLVSSGHEAGFTAADSNSHIGVWFTDGTVAGTVELPGVTGNSYGVPITGFAGGRFAFIAKDVAGVSQLYVSDGTVAGTAPLSVPDASAAGLQPDAVMALGSEIVFDGVTASGARALFISDGTSAGTKVLQTGLQLHAGNVGTDGAAVGGTVAYAETGTGNAGTVTSDIYTGPVSYLQSQFIWGSSTGVGVHAQSANTFLKGGAGDDALAAVGGSSVLDGSTGSNFLVGADGSDGGADVFFVDGRGGGVTWSTLVNFHQGDSATIWGFHNGLSTMPFTASDGVDGYKGLTIHAELNGAGTGVDASLTLAGIDQATADAHFSITTGSVGGNDYLLIQYNH